MFRSRASAMFICFSCAQPPSRGRARVRRVPVNAHRLRRNFRRPRPRRRALSPFPSSRTGRVSGPGCARYQTIGWLVCKTEARRWRTSGLPCSTASNRVGDLGPATRGTAPDPPGEREREVFAVGIRRPREEQVAEGTPEGVAVVRCEGGPASSPSSRARATVSRVATAPAAWVGPSVPSIATLNTATRAFAGLGRRSSARAAARASSWLRPPVPRPRRVTVVSADSP